MESCHGPGMFITDPDFSILDPGSRILDPGSPILDPGSRISDTGSKKNKKVEGKQICCLNFFVVIHFTKLKIIYFGTVTEFFCLPNANYGYQKI